MSSALSDDDDAVRQPHAGAGWPLALPFAPDMLANLRWKQRALARADAIIAVSHTIAADLRAARRARPPCEPQIIPNLIGLDVIAAAAATPSPAGVQRPYAVDVGQLAPNKGAAHLVPALRAPGWHGR